MRQKEISKTDQGRWATKRDLNVLELRTALRIERIIGKITKSEDRINAIDQKMETRLARSTTNHLYHIYGLAMILLGAMAVLAAIFG